MVVNKLQGYGTAWDAVKASAYIPMQIKGALHDIGMSWKSYCKGDGFNGWEAVNDAASIVGSVISAPMAAASDAVDSRSKAGVHEDSGALDIFYIALSPFIYPMIEAGKPGVRNGARNAGKEKRAEYREKATRSARDTGDVDNLTHAKPSQEVYGQMFKKLRSMTNGLNGHSYDLDWFLGSVGDGLYVPDTECGRLYKALFMDDVDRAFFTAAPVAVRAEAVKSLKKAVAVSGGLEDADSCMSDAKTGMVSYMSRARLLGSHPEGFSVAQDHVRERVKHYARQARKEGRAIKRELKKGKGTVYSVGELLRFHEAAGEIDKLIGIGLYDVGDPQTMFSSETEGTINRLESLQNPYKTAMEYCVKFSCALARAPDEVLFTKRVMVDVKFVSDYFRYLSAKIGDGDFVRKAYEAAKEAGRTMEGRYEAFAAKQGQAG